MQTKVQKVSALKASELWDKVDALVRRPELPILVILIFLALLLSTAFYLEIARKLALPGSIR
jgi:hypothetical protein